DEPADAELVLRELSRSREVTAEVVASEAATRAALAGASWDLILAEWSMPGFGALAALDIVRELGLDIPVIIVSGSISEDAAGSAMRAGAHDSVRKDRLSRLAPAVERELREAETRAARRRAE